MRTRPDATMYRPRHGSPVVNSTWPAPYARSRERSASRRRAASPKLARDACEAELRLAVFAPQWADVVEEALGWPGLADGVWWFHAHTKDNQWAVAAEVRESLTDGLAADLHGVPDERRRDA